MPYKYAKKLRLDKLRADLAARKKNKIKQQQKEKQEDSNAESAGSEEEDEKDVELDNSLDAPLFEVLRGSSHETHPALNQGLGQSCNSERPLNLYPNAVLTIPLPLYVSNRCTPIVDICLNRPMEHYEWIRQLGVYNTRYHTNNKRIKHRERKHNEQIYNLYLYEVAENIAMQDNLYFKDSYDYYYTGGGLNLMQYAAAGEESKTLALHLSGEKLQQLLISQVGKDAELWRPLHTESLEGMSSEIFELLPISSFRVNHGNMFLARMLKDIAIYELKRVDDASDNEEDEEKEGKDQVQSKYELNSMCKYSNDSEPFISVAQAINRATTLAVACEDRSLRFMDLVTHKDISKHDVKGVEKGSSWAQVRAWQENCFNYACQSVLLTIDMRCPNDVINPCFASSMYSKNCESFSCLGRSANPNLLYVASNHKLHCLDMRCLGKKLTDRSVVTWTHQMSVPPTYIDALVQEGSEYIAVGSLVPNDQVICELNGALAQNFSEMSSPSLPYASVQLSEALMEARLNGCVDIYADLGQRIKCSTTGLKFHRLENASDGAFAQLLTSNSIGDVYCQRVTLREEQEMKREERTGEHTHEAIKYYGELVRSRVKRQLKCTEVQPMQLMREIIGFEPVEEPEKPLDIKDVSINYGFEDSASEMDDGPLSQEPTTSSQKRNKIATETPKETKVDEPKKKAVSRGPWQKSAYYLSRFTDVISTRMLSIWDIDEFELTRDVEIDMIDEKLKKNMNKEQEEDRTASWLQQLPTQIEPNQEKVEFDIVPGTDLPTCYEAPYADYLEETEGRGIKNETFDESISFSRQACSTLKPHEFTVIENPIINPPAKKRKTKHIMGF